MQEKIDLHIHSSYSDGLYTPEQIIKMAKQNNLRAVSITDHDTISGLPEAMKYGKLHNIEVVPGVEVSCNFEGREIHVLGYYYYIPGRLEKLLLRFKEDRYERAYRMLNKLKKINIRIGWKELMKEVGKAAPGRLHLARVMVKKGYVNLIEDAFDGFLKRGRPAYIPRKKLSCEETIRILNRSGAVTVLAHPGITGEDRESIGYFKKVGIKGVEAFHSEHEKQQNEYYKKISKEEGLLVTGGSDFHGDGNIIYPGYISLDYGTLVNIKKEKLRYAYNKNAFL